MTNNAGGNNTSEITLTYFDPRRLAREGEGENEEKHHEVIEWLNAEFVYTEPHELMGVKVHETTSKIELGFRGTVHYHCSKRST